MSTKELENAAKYQKYIATAFENAHIKEKLPTPQKVDVSEYNPAQVLALNNLQTVTDTNTASSIIGSLNENEINYLNKYFTSFKNSLPNKTIASIGDFTTRFNTFYVEDIGKSSTTILPTIEKPLLLKEKYTENELMNMSKRHVDDLFRIVFRDNNNRDIAKGDTILYIGTNGTEVKSPVKIVDVKDYVAFSLPRGKQSSENIKIRYIYEHKGDSTLLGRKSLEFKWKGSTVSEEAEGSGFLNKKSMSGVPFLKSKLLKKKLVHFR